MPDQDAAHYFYRFEKAYRDASDPRSAQGQLVRAIADAILEQGAIPLSMEPTFRALREAWATNDPDPGVLLDAKRTVWAALEAKNGNSTSIVDAADRALRALLCLADPVPPAEAIDTAGWAAEMLSTEQWPRPTKYF